ncbi:GntR family transcriptional regulator [Yoonia sediminilitoris]|uniref:GntR family transcriptional regulator n=1 Tax=Yoonia sediminilitoris TaxID=1286148 RepID=A0A2T6KQW8_9RHOB|nr:GntR family transcriptional regulator [Yoonia sediminilitoris]PUB18951.1 GntR family transcriptional regulator [Yoonia sediminilitoris]RCW99119.1 GntR family transcriptional regulator [Yoonia sediminilitoris]
MTQKILAAQIANQLRRDILQGKLPPGSAIKERDNAAELGVSRTPLREAIRILATEGLVELRPARSPIVSIPTIKQISDDVEVLLSVEKLSGELACARATEEEIASIADIVDDMAARFDTADPLDMFETDMSFHSALANAAHNVPLSEIHHKFLARLWRARYLAAVQRRNRERVIDHHSSIVDALRARDPQAIRATIGKHLANLREDIITCVKEDLASASDDPATDNG